MRILKYLLAAVLTAYVVVAVAWSRDVASARRCVRIDISVADSAGSGFVGAADVARELAGLPRRAPGMLLADIDTDSIERMLNAIDKIESATSTVFTDGHVELTVVPMQPVARVFDTSTPEARSYYINRQGKRISASAAYHTDVPVISGHFDSSFRPAALVPLIEYVTSRPQWDRLITHIKVDGPTNIILVPMIHGHVINLGDTSGLDDKFGRVALAYKKILPLKGWEYYDTVSVKWRGQIVATRRQKKLAPVVNPADYEAEQEAPDLGTMMAADTLSVGRSQKKSTSKTS